jgi:anti-sigma B factor antagonist
MGLRRVDAGAITTVHVDGTLDITVADELRALSRELLATGRTTIVLDLGHLRLIDSAGIGAVVALYKRVVDHKGSLKLSGLCDQPLAMFKVLRLDRVFSFTK